MKTEDELREWAAGDQSLIAGYRQGAKDAAAEAEARLVRIDQLRDELHRERRAHDNARWREAQARVKALEEMKAAMHRGEEWTWVHEQLTQARKGL